jgi:N-methylhydantoinase B/oxoprolinase/acetone carboxylase alpha subunit
MQCREKNSAQSAMRWMAAWGAALRLDDAQVQTGFGSHVFRTPDRRPFRVRRYAVRRGSGGRDRYRGGNGIIRDIQLLDPGEVTILSDRRTRGPCGLQGGVPGPPGQNVLIAPDGAEREMPSKFSVWMEAGTTISVRSPGGGGFGRPG